jgi:hypothetical protein
MKINQKRIVIFCFLSTTIHAADNKQAVVSSGIYEEEMKKFNLWEKLPVELPPLEFVGPLVERQPLVIAPSRFVLAKNAVKESAENLLVGAWQNKASVLASALVLYAAGYCAVSAGEAFVEADYGNLKHSVGPLFFMTMSTGLFTARCINNYKKNASIV